MARCDRPLAGGDWESSVRPGAVSTWANWLRCFRRDAGRRRRGLWTSSSPLPRDTVASVRSHYVSSKHRMTTKERLDEKDTLAEDHRRRPGATGGQTPEPGRRRSGDRRDRWPGHHYDL